MEIIQGQKLTWLLDEHDLYSAATLRKSSVVGDARYIAMNYSPFNGIGEASVLDKGVFALQPQLMLLNQYLAAQDHENALAYQLMLDTIP